MNDERRSAVRVFVFGGLLALALAATCVVFLWRNRARGFEPDPIALDAWLASVPREGFRPTVVERTPYHWTAFGTVDGGGWLWTLRHDEGHLRGNHRTGFVTDGDVETSRFEFGGRSEGWDLATDGAGWVHVSLEERDLGEIGGFGPFRAVQDPRTCERIALRTDWGAAPIPAARLALPFEPWRAALPLEHGRLLVFLRTTRHDLYVQRTSADDLRVAVRHDHAENATGAELLVEARGPARRVPQQIRQLAFAEHETLAAPDGTPDVHDELWLYAPPPEETETLRIVLGEALAAGAPEPIELELAWD